MTLVLLVLLGGCLISSHALPQAAGVRHSALVLAAVLLGLAMIVLFWFRRASNPIASDLSASRILRFLRRTLSAARTLSKQPALLAKSMLLSLGIHLSAITYHCLLSQALGLDIALTSFLITVPAVNLALALPITIAGIGVFEGTMVVYWSTDSCAVQNQP